MKQYCGEQPALWVLLITILWSLAVAVPAACPPVGWSRARLAALAGQHIERIAPAEQADLALGLLSCLAAPDPSLRDQLGFETLARLLRDGQLDPATKLRMTRELLPRLAEADAAGVAAPFAALTLSELVRADRMQPFLPAPLRDAVAASAIRFLDATRDYRGFDARVGWRHRVAHGADLVAQLVRNPAIADPALLLQLRDAVARQIRPSGHFYVYGEPQRLAAAIVALAQRRLITTEQWSAWFEIISAPAPRASWNAAMQSQAGLADRHNVAAFLQAVWMSAHFSANAGDDVLLPGAEAALRRVP